jgi:hypothetical protein
LDENENLGGTLKKTEYGGVLHEFSLDSINKQYDTIMKNKKKYVGMNATTQ